MQKSTIIGLAGGGTGGHIFPLLSIVNYLKDEQEYVFLWFGEEGGLEEGIAQKNSIPFFDIPAGKIRRYFDIRNFYEPLKNITGFVFSLYYIWRHKIDIIFSKGGYVSLPVCLAAYVLRRKIYIHESDIVAGVSNNIVAKIAKKVFYTFPNKATQMHPHKHICTGQILNPELLDSLTSLDVTENEHLNVIVIAGSQGSTSIFETLLPLIPKLGDIVFHVILGDKNFHFSSAFQPFSNVKIYDFITQKELGKILQNIDIAITRGGATSLWELNAFGIHSIIIPLVHSAGNHQYENACYFKERFGSDILEESEHLESSLYKKLSLYKDLRKTGLNLDNFFGALKVIKKEIEG